MNTNTVFRLINPVYDTDTYLFKVNVFTKQAKSEQNLVCFPSLRALNTQAGVAAGRVLSQCASGAHHGFYPAGRIGAPGLLLTTFWSFCV